ncbi:uncharacterized protein DS421_6g189160 [Arachis hypogaea]|uniref:Uncharacterized protein n=1 Tax=Arachis hypogaea TaxID=3818 RepID=A0A445CQW1_ARAHY|nr:uncharacterized protein DS421_6g189160 [Arachis hypogaea]RYR53275.1 hypothetical protein Ahy_A06g028289 [Arachis hypogaea]
MRDIHAKDSVELLRSQGLDFARNAVAGVSSVHFAKLAAASGGVHPTSSGEFLVLVKELFGGNAYDVKHVMRFCNGLYGGLEKVADTL